MDPLHIKTEEEAFHAHQTPDQEQDEEDMQDMLLTAKMRDVVRRKAVAAASQRSTAAIARTNVSNKAKLMKKTIDAWFIARRSLCTVVNIDEKPYYIYADVSHRRAKSFKPLEWLKTMDSLIQHFKVMQDHFNNNTVDQNVNVARNEIGRHAHLLRNIQPGCVSIGSVFCRLIADYVVNSTVKCAVKICVKDVDPNLTVRSAIRVHTNENIAEDHELRTMPIRPSLETLDALEGSDMASIIEYYSDVTTQKDVVKTPPSIIMKRLATCHSANILPVNVRSEPPLTIPENVIMNALAQLMSAEEIAKLIAGASNTFGIRAQPQHANTPLIHPITKHFHHDLADNRDGICQLVAAYLSYQRDADELKETEKMTKIKSELHHTEVFETVAKMENGATDADITDAKVRKQIEKDIVGMVKTHRNDFVGKSQVVQYEDGGTQKVATVTIKGAKAAVDENGVERPGEFEFPNNIPTSIPLGIYTQAMMQVMGDDEMANTMMTAAVHDNEDENGGDVDVENLLTQFALSLDLTAFVRDTVRIATETHIMIHSESVKVGFKLQAENKLYLPA